MRVTLTGASGFVGRQAAAALLAAGVDLTAIGRADPGLGCRFFAADLLDADAMRAAVTATRPQIVLHLAWCVEHGRFWTDPANAHWAEATLAFALACADAGAHRFVGVGTGYEYDWPVDGDCDEARTPLAAHTPYDAAKSACRSAQEALAGERDLAFAWARLFFLYGPGEDPRRLVSSLARSLAGGEQAACSRGLAIRDFMDVRDAGAALAALALSPAEGAVNVASGRAVTVAEIAQTLGRLSGRPDLIRLGALPDREGEPARITADVGRLHEAVGYTHGRGLEAGLADALAYWAARQD